MISSPQTFSILILIKYLEIFKFAQHKFLILILIVQVLPYTLINQLLNS